MFIHGEPARPIRRAALGPSQMAAAPLLITSMTNFGISECPLGHIRLTTPPFTWARPWWRRLPDFPGCHSSTQLALFPNTAVYGWGEPELRARRGW